jgi:hypothetical protein
MMAKKEVDERLLVGLTGWTDEHWKSKIEEINKYNIQEIALFFEMFRSRQRREIIDALLISKVKSIPFVHLRNEMRKDEIKLLKEKFGTKYFSIHESTFKSMKKWNGFHKDLYVEFNADNKLPKNMNVDKIGGLCVDLSHFMVEKKLQSKEYKYIMENKDNKKYFKCNHINGYSYKKNSDVHTVKSLRQFEYIKGLPNFLFSEVIPIETFNSIKEQLKFKKHLTKMLRKKLKN